MDGSSKTISKEEEQLLLNENKGNKENKNEATIKEEEEEKEKEKEKEIQKKMKSLEGMKFQKTQLSQWQEEDKSRLDFSLSIKDLDSFLSGDFEIEDIKSLKSIKQINEWNCIKQKEEIENQTNRSAFQTQNIILKNKIIKMANSNISLRTLGVQCEITILMSGESHFYIFSRLDDKFTNQTALCIISKELESARKFVCFSILESDESNKLIIRNIKKQEIPRQENYIKALDISEIKLTFVDNGDHRCFIFLDNQEQNSNLLFIADFYIPINTPCNVMFGVTGDLISLKQLKISQINRDSCINYKNGNKNNVQACNCCICF